MPFSDYSKSRHVRGILTYNDPRSIARPRSMSFRVATPVDGPGWRAFQFSRVQRTERQSAETSRDSLLCRAAALGPYSTRQVFARVGQLDGQLELFMLSPLSAGLWYSTVSGIHQKNSSSCGSSVVEASYHRVIYWMVQLATELNGCSSHPSGHKEYYRQGAALARSACERTDQRSPDVS
ncbi:hypothetical protein CONLIGDRAFT_125751 [Coniochaeta ligniaria NRRL 30616]|uniref:Uncharacterized protein n=1 Tax=Coniochaeta ligniaria NRRL 30616 TaxID=1408157 RepID=A0A1J7I8X7_9PEZI|nr:hypothetical protein CONLIGDRAFT_125751 [Coniochaeta ligniaria NRRL 30616]